MRFTRHYFSRRCSTEKKKTECAVQMITNTCRWGYNHEELRVTKENITRCKRDIHVNKTWSHFTRVGFSFATKDETQHCCLWGEMTLEAPVRSAHKEVMNAKWAFTRESYDTTKRTHAGFLENSQLKIKSPCSGDWTQQHHIPGTVALPTELTGSTAEPRYNEHRYNELSDVTNYRI